MQAAATLFLPVIGFGLACASSAPRAYEAPVGVSVYEPDPEGPAPPPRTAQPVERPPGTSLALPAPLRSRGPDEGSIGDGGSFVDDDESLVDDDPASEGAGGETVESVEP